MIDSCIGLDPGPTTGMCFLDYNGGRLVGRTVLQAGGDSAVVVLRGMLHTYYGTSEIGRRVASVEKFVTGASAGSRGGNADVTRQLVMELAEACQLFGYSVVIRPAADVKPWASNKRLVAAGVAKSEKSLTDSLRHGWDAARHAIFGARERGVIQDPLSRQYRELKGAP